MGKSLLSKHLSRLGKKGGKARLKTMTPEERREVARKAGIASAEARKASKAAQARTRKVKERKAAKARWTKQKGMFSRDTET